jgi:Glycosyl transferase family 90/Stf0 sulphotransferase
MTELLAQRPHRRIDVTTMNAFKSRTKLILAVTIAFISGKFTEYTYVRRISTQTHFNNSSNEIKSFPNEDMLHSRKRQRQHDDVNLKGSVTPNQVPSKALQVTTGRAPPSTSFNTFFTIVSDPRSGAEYVMDVLEQHDLMCSSGDYPKSALLPVTMPWMSDDSTEKGCTLAFIRDSIFDITSKNNFESRCSSKYDASKDKYNNHLKRFCSFISALNHNYTNEAITNLFVEAFAQNNTNIFAGCNCPETAQIRGMKVSTEWIGQIPIENTLIKGSKIIRLTRKNYFERYLSFIIANLSGQWSIQNAHDKDYQLTLFQDENYEIDIDEMLFHFEFMNETEQTVTEWVNENGSQILWVDRNQLLDDPTHVFKQIYEFLGVKEGKDNDLAEFLRRLESANIIDESLKQFNGAKLLDYISNRDAVVESLNAHGYGEFIEVYESYNPIHHLVLTNDANFRIYNSRKGYEVTILNEEKYTDTTIEPSARFVAAIPVLRQMSQDTIVIVSNGQAGSLNPHIRGSQTLFTALSNVRTIFRDFIPTEAILVSVSNDCCSNTMQHTKPGTLFHPNGPRSRTCRGNECEKVTIDDESTNAWINFMKQQSIKYGWNQSDNIYLDGTFIAGSAQSILDFITELDVLSWEDDRSVLSDYMHRFPNKIVLDYEQNVFAGRFDGYVSKMNLVCDVDYSRDNFDSIYTRTSNPLIVSSNRNQQSCVRNDTIETFPKWDNDGIPIIPILDHIERVLVHNVSMAGIDRHFDKEILYIIDHNGIWASDVIRDKYRVKPTERFLLQAHHMLKNIDHDTQRWSNLKRVVESSGFPYWSWYGDWKDCNFHNVGLDSIPLFTTCAMTTCNNSFPMPSYMTIIDSQIDTTHWYHLFHEFDTKYRWENKIRKVVWRGGLSENDPNKVFTSQRWRLCKYVSSLPNMKQKDMFDIGLTNIPEFLTAQIDIDASIVGGIVKGIAPMNDFQNYIAVLDMDGNSWSSRFGTMLCYNSVAIKVEPAYADYWIYDLVPWKHYIPIKNDLSDLLENIEFVLDPMNDSIVQEIIYNANQWCSERFTQNGLISDMLDIWDRYVQLLDHADPDWTTIWETKKKQLFSSTTNISLMQQLTYAMLE